MAKRLKKLRRKVKKFAKGKVRAAKKERREFKRLVRRKKRRRRAGIPPLGSIVTGDPLAEK